MFNIHLSPGRAAMLYTAMVMATTLLLELIHADQVNPPGGKHTGLDGSDYSHLHFRRIG